MISLKLNVFLYENNAIEAIRAFLNSFLNTTLWFKIYFTHENNAHEIVYQDF